MAAPAGLADQLLRMHRWLGLAASAAPALVLVWLLFPHDRAVNELGVVLSCVSGMAGSAAMLLLPPRLLPERAIKALVALAAVAVSATIFFTVEYSPDFELFLLWTTPYAAFFYSARHAALQTAWVGVCLGMAYWLQGVVYGPRAHTEDHVVQWIVVMATLVIIGALVRALAQWLRATDARLRTGFDRSRLGLALVSSDLRLLEVNDALCCMLRRPREELVGASLNDFVHPDDLAAVDEVALQQAEGGSFERRFIRADGSLVPAQVNTTLVRPADATVPYYFSQIEDITERRREQDELAHRTRQQETVARLGRVALNATDLHALMQEVVEAVSATLDVELCKVLQLADDGPRLELVAGVGWDEDLVRSATLSADPMSAARYTLDSERPVVIEDLATETRFAPSWFLAATAWSAA